MYTWWELLAKLNWIDRLEGIISTIRHADWRGAWEKGGLSGLISEAGRCLAGRTTWRLSIDRHCGYSGAQIEQFLRRYGVKIWNRGFTKETLWFNVKRRQANWAEYLLQRKGVAVHSRPFNEKNQEYGQKYEPGSEPPQGRRAQGKDIFESIYDYLFE